MSAIGGPDPFLLEFKSNTVHVAVGNLSEPGTLLLYKAASLDSLSSSTSVVFQTYTPLSQDQRVPLQPASNASQFYRAVWQPALVPVYQSGSYSNAPVLADIPAGTFLMGSPTSELLRSTSEGPQTLVTFSYCFKMGKYPVTQAQYKSLMSNNPSYFAGNPARPIELTRPVEQVSWFDAMEYCRRLTAVEQQAGYLPQNWAYRLPTEAEWEYACRAGTTTAFGYGASLLSGMANFYGVYEYDSSIGEIINLTGIHLMKTTPVGSYAPNNWGLYDMHGNVSEWCLDWWSNKLPGGSITNLQGPASGLYRSIRGGCWYNDAWACRSAYRLSDAPGYNSNDVGFRIVLAPNAADPRE